MSKEVPEVVETIALLELARDLIAKPGGWCQRTLARKKGGAATHPQDTSAVSFCMLGACERVASERGGGWFERRYRTAAALEKTLFFDQDSRPDSLAQWNDCVAKEQAAVVQVFDDTIQRLREQGK